MDAQLATGLFTSLAVTLVVVLDLYTATDTDPLPYAPRRSRLRSDRAPARSRGASPRT